MALHSVTREMKSLLQNQAFMVALDVDELKDDMKLDKPPAAKSGILSILETVLGIASIGAMGNPMAKAAMGLVGGFIGMIGEANQPYVFTRLQ